MSSEGNCKKDRERPPKRNLTECLATSTPVVDCPEPESCRTVSPKRRRSELSLHNVFAVIEDFRRFNVKRLAAEAKDTGYGKFDELKEFDAELLSRIVFAFVESSGDLRALEKRVQTDSLSGTEDEEESGRVPLTLEILNCSNDLLTLGVDFDRDSFESDDSSEQMPKWHLKYSVLSALNDSDVGTITAADNENLHAFLFEWFETCAESKLLDFDTIDEGTDAFCLKLTPSLTRRICIIQLRLEMTSSRMTQWSAPMFTVIDTFQLEETDEILQFSFGNLAQYRRVGDSLWTEAIVLSHEKGTEDGTANDGKVRLIEREMGQGSGEWQTHEIAMLFTEDFKRTLSDEQKPEFERFLSENDDIRQLKAELRAENIPIPQVIECNASEVMRCGMDARYIVDISNRFEVESRALLSGFVPLLDVLETYRAIMASTKSLVKNADFVPFLVTGFLFEREFRARVNCFECSRNCGPPAVLRPTVVWSAVLQQFAKCVAKENERRAVETGDGDEHSEGNTLPAFISKECDLCQCGLDNCSIAYMCHTEENHDFCLNCIARVVLRQQAIGQVLSDCLSDALNDDCISEIVHFVVGVVRV